MVRSTVQDQSGQIVCETLPPAPISKITRAKWAGDMAQAVEHLPCKRKTLEFKPQSFKKKKKRSTITMSFNYFPTYQ
jgi:truncated hemoglobin YjbI